MIIPERLFKEPIKNKIIKIYNPKPIKQIAKENVKLIDKQLIKNSEKMLSP